MNKRIVTTTVAAGIAAGMVFGLSACGGDKPPADFAKACKHVGGKTMREHDFERKYLGMAPMAFEIAPEKPGGGSHAARTSKSKSSKSKSSKTKTNKNKTSKLSKLKGIGSGYGAAKPTKTKKPKKHNDNEWVCVKNGVELFDQ